MDGQLRPTSHHHASGHRTLPSFAGAGTDQLSLELSQATQDVSMSRPWAVVVSAQVSRSDLNPAPLSATAPRIFKRSRVDRASLSSLVTTRISPLSSPAISRASCLRSARAPLTLTFSWNKGVAGIYARWHVFEEKREAVMAPGIIERVSLWARQPIANGHAGAAGLFD
jgi:hypothetical protein